MRLVFAASSSVPIGVELETMIMFIEVMHAVLDAHRSSTKGIYLMPSWTVDSARSTCLREAFTFRRRIFEATSTSTSAMMLNSRGIEF